MFTSKVWTDDSKLLQESNLTARQPRRVPYHDIHSPTSEGLAQGSYLAARMGFKPATLDAQGAELTAEPPRPIGGTELLCVYEGLALERSLHSKCLKLGSVPYSTLYKQDALLSWLRCESSQLVLLRNRNDLWRQVNRDEEHGSE